MYPDFEALQMRKSKAVIEEAFRERVAVVDDSVRESTAGVVQAASRKWVRELISVPCDTRLSSGPGPAEGRLGEAGR